MLKRSLFFISHFLCLSLGFAQTSVPTPNRNTAPAAASATQTQSQTPALPLTQMPTTISPNPSQGQSSANPAPGSPTLAAPAPPGGTTPDSLLNLVGSVNAGKGKYEEYQSICRENLFDTPATQDSETQKKRIDDLLGKIKVAKNPTLARIHLLKEYLDQEKTAALEELYKKIKEEKLLEEEGKVADALLAYSRGEPNRAESLLAKVVIENPKNKLALGYLAEIYALDQNYFEAASAYFDLAKLTQESYDLQFCEIQTLDSQHKEGEKSCKKAAQRHEKNPYPLIYLGISQRERLYYDKAIQYFKESLRKQQTEMGFVCLGEIYFIKENFTGATELFRRALKIYPDSSRAMLGMAWSQIKDKKFTDALDTFKQACLRDRKIATDIRRAYKILSEEKSMLSRQFADLAQKCSE